jgi:hypothetical protein
VLLHSGVRRAGGNLDLEFNQELATGAETPMFFTPPG